MKSSRYLLLLALSLLLAAGCGTAPVTQPVPSLSPASSTAEHARVTPVQPTFTPTLNPTSTPAPDPAQIQREALHQASLQYLAADEATAFAVAHSLGYSEDYGTPKDMCGPLAMAILRDAGIVSRYTDLRDFWLLYPPEDAYLLDRSFPEDTFEWLHMGQAINRVDYNQFPLKAGDLLFIYSGERGDYSHVLVVTRVDEKGRAYSVTNNYTETGFVIQEYMLYDPEDPGEGIFYEWTDPANAALGLTGFGGYDLWRPKTLPYQADPGDAMLAAALDGILADSGGDWYLRIETLDGEVLYSRRANYHLSGASAIRLPLGMLLMKALEARNIATIQTYIKNNIWNGRSYHAWLYDMYIRKSPEAVLSLREAPAQLGLDVSATLHSWGLKNTYLSANTTSAEDLAILLKSLQQGNVLQTEAQQALLTFMDGQFLSEADIQEDTLRSQSPGGYDIYNLPLTAGGDYPIVSHLAILEKEEKAYLVVIFGYPGGSDSTPVSLREQVQTMENLSGAIWQYLGQR